MEKFPIYYEFSEKCKVNCEIGSCDANLYSSVTLVIKLRIAEFT